MKNYKDGMIGFVIGDAFGVPAESKKREELLRSPILNMIDSPNRYVSAGTWSDDTAMTLATMDSYIREGSIQCVDIADRFCDWVTKGEYTTDNKIFGIGSTTLSALTRYHKTGLAPTECGSKKESDNGNGSLMRMYPVAYYAHIKQLDSARLYLTVKNISSITHAHEISIMASFIYVKYAIYIFKGYTKKEAYDQICKFDYHLFFSEDTIYKFSRILEGDLLRLKIDDIKSSGYVIDTLESALWVILMSSNFNDAIIGSVNLGGDADTIAALTGSIAGLIYGFKAIPQKWIDKIKRKGYILTLCQQYEMVINN